MSGPATSSSGVDLSRLPAPTIVQTLTFEAILADLIVQVQDLLPEFDATLDSDPVMKLLQAFAYRELLLRAEANDAGKQVMTAYATGANLDHLAALVGVARLELDPGDPGEGIPPTMESDDALRQRIVLAPEGFSVAGPELAYVFHAKSASGDVLDASATSPEPGEVLVSVLARQGDGTAGADLIDAVAAVVNSRSVRPLGDLVTVASAEVVEFAIEATLYTCAVTDANGRPLSFLMTAGQISDYIGVAALLDELPKAQWLLADRGYDADWFRDALEEKGIKPCIPGRKSRNAPIKYHKRRHRRRSRIGIMFGRLKDWRRVATRYDRCPTAFFSAIALAATVIF